MRRKDFFKWSFGLRFLFVFLCALMCVGNAWGTTYYGKLRVIAVCEGGVTGKLAIGTTSKSRPANSSSDWKEVTGSNDPTIISSVYSNTPWIDLGSGTVSIYCYAMDDPTSNIYFQGWYDDAACTITKAIATSTSRENKDYSVSFTATSTTESNPTIGVIYAKFSNKPYYRYKNTLLLKSDQEGRVFTDAVYSIDGSAHFTQFTPTPGSNFKTSSGNKVFRAKSVEDKNYTFCHYMRAFPVHGKKISGITHSGESNIYAKDWKDKGNGLYELYYTISTRTAQTEIAAKCTTTVNYTSASELNVIISKPAGVGTISGIVGYYSYVDATKPTTSNLQHQDINIALNKEDDSKTAKNLSGLSAIYEGDQITLTAIPDMTNGEIFLGWYKINPSTKQEELYTTDLQFEAYLTESVEYFAKFHKVVEGDNFLANNLVLTDLHDALEAVKSSSNKTILVLRNCTVPQGIYTIPEDVTLLIPYKDGQVESTALRREATDGVPSGAYRTLTLAQGAHFEVYGTIEVSGCQTTGGANAGGDKGLGRPAAPYYGMIDMKSGSSMTLNSGAVLKSWGYIIGDRDAEGKYTCEIDARRGSEVYEQFQLMDWKGVYHTMHVCDKDWIYHVLPVSQYYIQSVEVPTRYRPGSRLFGASSVNWGITVAMDNAGVVGIRYSATLKDDAIFLLDDADNSEDTWVRKFYDPATDQQVYEINNSAYLGSLAMTVTIPGLSTIMNRATDALNIYSVGYQLPITNNFKMHLLSGKMYITQDTELLPGVELEVNKKSTLVINSDATLLLYDSDNWGNYVTNEYISSAAQGTYGFGYATKVKYRPGGVPDVRDIEDLDKIGDAKLIVHGSVDIQGKLKTTDGGASITSTIEDAGTVIISTATAAASDNDKTYQVSALYETEEKGGHSYVDYSPIHRVPALLQNATGSQTSTASRSANESFCYIDFNGVGTWKSLTTDGCFVYDENDVYYAKPKEYVALANGKTANADHTYSDAAGQGRLFIVTPDCQWWEVEKKDNLYHCINPDNDTYYYWDDEDKNDQYWREKEFQICWTNWDGSSINWDGTTEETKYQNHVIYNLNYGITPKYLEDKNPTREDNLDYTYNFIGWTPEIVPVTGNATYTAVYEAIQKKYTIIFKDEIGNEIERHLLAHNEMPVCENTPTKEDHILQWSPALAAVTGDAIYQATWLDSEPEAYEITFFDYDGTTILQQGNVNVDATPVAPAITNGIPAGSAGKPATSEYTYVFDHWSPAVTKVSHPGPKSYTAVYREVDLTYDVKFYQEDGTTQIGTTQNLAFGADPVIPNYSKAATAQYTYTLKWLDKGFESEDPEDYEAVASVNVPSVTADASYKAYFTETLNKYTVTLQSNLPGKCSFTGAGTYDYNTNVTIEATPAEGYEFVKWQEREGGANLGTLPLTSDITLTAVLKESTAATPENLNVNDGEVNVPSATNYMDLTIFSDGAEASGQLTGATNVTLLGNANFVFKKNIKAGYWYSFAVPWRVDAQSGVYFGGSNTPAVLGKDFEIVYYDGAVRAAQGKVDACWVYMKNLSTKKILEPGRAYMIFIKHGSQSQIVFRKKVQEPLLTTSVNVEQYNASDVLNANWNAIANPALYNAYIYAGDDPKGFYYKSEEDNFDWYPLNSSKLVVGEAVYIQAPEAGTIIANSNSYSAAPRRERAEQATSFDVQIAAAGATKRADHISVQIDENKEENKYVIGKDLTKFGVSARVAQMWIDRYDVKLCFNTIAPEGEATFFPMSIYAPKAGTYTIAIEREVATDDYALYLTYNGEAIWNLSEGAYTANLNKGTDANYGLRISAKAPQVVTGVDEAVVDAKGETHKVLINNQVFIIRGNQVYSIDGQLVIR